MDYKVIDPKNKVVKITCEIKDYLNGNVEDFVKVARRMKANKVIIELDNKEGGEYGSVL